MPQSRPARWFPLVLSLPWCAAVAADGLGRLHDFGGWSVGCDNTRRCEAHGYHGAAEDEPPLVLQVQRDAGPRASPRLRLGFGDDGSPRPAPPAGTPVSVQVGPLRLALPPLDAEGFTEASPEQVRQLMPWVLKARSLQVVTPGRRGTVDLGGATAALLKMDDLQQRVGTAGAIVRPGPRPDSAVPPPPPLPAVTGVVVPPARDGDLERMASLRATLKIDDDECPLMTESPTAPPAQVLRVSATRVIAVFDCWRAAYQEGSAAWLANDRPPHAQPVRFEAPGEAADGNDTPTMLSLSRDAGGRLVAHSAAKGRGVGDCWSMRQWVWDGRRFALTEATVSPCAGFRAGGLPITLWRSAPGPAPAR